MNGRVARWRRAMSAIWRRIDLTLGGPSALLIGPLSIFPGFFVAYPTYTFSKRNSKKGLTHDCLRVGFLVCVDPHLHIEATMTSIRVRQNIFTNRNVNEGKIWPTVAGHTHRGSRRRGASHRFGYLGGECSPSACSCLPLHSGMHIG